AAKSGTQVTCQKGAWGLGANLAVSVLDVSETGLRLLLNSSLDRGQELTLTLLVPGKSRPFKVLARTIWSVETADGNHCVGATFEQRLTYADLINVTAIRCCR